MDACLAALPSLLDSFRSVAPETERSTQIPRRHLERLAEIGFFRLAVPARWGGFEAPAWVLWEAAEQMAGACGATHFVQTQHQGAIGFLLRSQHLKTIENNLSDWLEGRRFCGVAFAHLRRPQCPVEVAISDEFAVYQGSAPWFSGWGVMDQVVLAGRNQLGLGIYALAGLDQDGLRAGEQLSMAALNASATVPLEIEQLKIPSDQILFTQSAEEMADKDYASLLKHSASALGLVHEACRWMQSEPQSVEVLVRKAAALRQRGLEWQGDDQEALAIRTESNQLALHAAQAAILASGGGGNQSQHPAQRLLRESSFYFLTQLSQALRGAALKRLVET